MTARVIGLTGGIGSGKTTVAARLAARGVHWVDADVVAREVVAVGSPGLAAVLAAFGPTYATSRGELDRKRMGALVFADADARRRLEAIVHPAIRAGIAARLADARAAGQAWSMIDAALLVEMGLDAEVDDVVAVLAPRPLRVARVVARDGLDVQAVEARLAAQASDAQLRARADYVLDNDGDLASLEDKVAHLWRWLQERATTGVRLTGREPAA